MHTSMFKIPSGTHFGDLALIFGLSLRAQNAVRQVFYVKNFPLRGVRSWPRGPPSPACTHYPNHKICPVRSFSGTSPCIFRPASGIGFRPATPAGFTSPKSLSRVLEFLFYMWCRNSRWVFFIPNRSKHLPAHGLVLTPLREISFLLQKIDQKIDQETR